MSTQQKQSVLSIKDKQTIISLLEKGKKGTNVALKVKEKILKFTHSIKMSKGFKIRDTYSPYINSSKS